jgi:hypothetical protein
MVGVVGTSLSTMTDEQGRFTIANVPKGQRRLAAQHDVIDALGMSGITASTNVTDGKEPVQLVVPSFNRLWSYACGRPVPAGDTGFVFGTVRPGEKRFAKSTVAVSWVEIAPKGIDVRVNQKTLHVDTDSTGGFAVCGVPTGASLSITATADSASSGTFDLDPIQSERVLRRDLTIAGKNPSVSGRVIADSTGAPIAGADVILDEMYQSARTNLLGEFVLAGVPPGSHLIRVNSQGFADRNGRFDVEAADMRTPDIILPKAGSDPEPTTVTRAQISPDQLLAIFNAARSKGRGYFITRAQFDSFPGRAVPEMMMQWPGVKVVRLRASYALMTKRTGPMSPVCQVLAFVNDGFEPNFDLNDFQATQLEAIAYYPVGMIPKEYDVVNAKCGVLTVITRR